MNGINWLGAPLALGLVVLGVWWLAALDHLLAARAASGRWRPQAVLEPRRRALRELFKEFRHTERPDPILWLSAPVLLMVLTLAALTVFPLGPELIGFDSAVGVVLMTAMFALVLVAAFWAGWGPNAKYPLIAGYRFIGLMLAYEMPLAITIIAVALPAESLALGQIVATQQQGLWNLLLQPLGLVIYLICALAVPFWGPFNVVNSPDLAGGPLAELSGAPRLLWRFGQYALLLTLAAFTVPLFLGGGAGPWLPAWVWTVLKVLAVSGLLVWTGRRLARLPLDWFMKWAWVALIPLSLFNLFLVGLLILIWPELAGKVR
ncbi:MAG: complex I subunit 1 family protein [Candidatus Competibacteraceae bacterium]|nr:complex I subunit 1 family protein [Candidatus Competibacteraceae bacterium]